MASGPTTSWEIDGETVETVSPSLQSTFVSDYPACYTNVNFKNRALLIKILVGFPSALRSLRIKSKIHTRPSII